MLHVQIVLLCCAVSWAQSPELTQDQVDEAMVLIDSAYAQAAEKVNADVTHEPLLGGTIRLAAHCSIGARGCSGCLNMNDSFNRGLEKTFTFVNDLYEGKAINVDGVGFTGLMSRADFWILCSHVVLRRAVAKAGAEMPPLHFKVGRKDCVSAPYSAVLESTPDAKDDFPFNFNLFNSRFGFTRRDYVALLGAHGLGRCRRFGSGYDGVWTSNADVLDNKFYQLMLNSSLDWRQTDVAKGWAGDRKWQWVSAASPNLLMLNSDMGLLKKLKPDGAGRAQCSFDACGPAPTADVVQEYADNNARWLIDFADVFQRFTETGSADLQVPRLRKPRRLRARRL